MRVEDSAADERPSWDGAHESRARDRWRARGGAGQRGHGGVRLGPDELRQLRRVLPDLSEALIRRLVEPPEGAEAEATDAEEHPDAEEVPDDNLADRIPRSRSGCGRQATSSVWWRR